MLMEEDAQENQKNGKGMVKHIALSTLSKNKSKEGRGKRLKLSSKGE